jgi:hypothetical protein
VSTNRDEAAEVFAAHITLANMGPCYPASLYLMGKEMEIINLIGYNG